jgi:NADH-quinone oxidoreductase subunit J
MLAATAASSEPWVMVPVCALTVASAILVILPRRPVRCAIALLAHSLCLAALYVALGADLVGIAQVVIYSGAIVVLFLFVVLLLPQGGREARVGPRRRFSALVGGGAFLAAVLVSAAVQVRSVTALPATGSVENVGRALFGELLVPMEMTAPLLLVAIIGAVTLWRRTEANDR